MKFDLKNQIESLKSFDWRSLQKYLSPKSMGDLNAFLEKLPQNAGKSTLMLAGAAWVLAGASGLYAAVQIKEITELKNGFYTAEALRPIVPAVKDAPLGTKEVAEFVDKMAKIYGDLSIKANGSTILITASSTASFGQFREAIGHIQNGGSGWRVSIERLCVGRECDKQPLGASLKINKVSVEKPS